MTEQLMRYLLTYNLRLIWRILEALSLSTNASAPEWEEARGKLRLQLMRTEHTLRAPVITFPFAGDVVVAIAIDLTHAYSVFVVTEAEVKPDVA